MADCTGVVTIHTGVSSDQVVIRDTVAIRDTVVIRYTVAICGTIAIRNTGKWCFDCKMVFFHNNSQIHSASSHMYSV